MISKNILILFFWLTFTEISTCEKLSTAAPTEEHLANQMNSASEQAESEQSTEMLGKPEALISYRHRVPVTLIQRVPYKVKRKPKPKPYTTKRPKRPKIKYGSPAHSSSYGEPLSYYEAIADSKPPRKFGKYKFGSNRYNEFENFYKELGPEFELEDVDDFSEEAETPIKIDFYEKTYLRNLKENKPRKKKTSKHRQHGHASFRDDDKDCVEDDGKRKHKFVSKYSSREPAESIGFQGNHHHHFGEPPEPYVTYRFPNISEYLLQPGVSTSAEDTDYSSPYVHQHESKWNYDDFQSESIPEFPKDLPLKTDKNSIYNYPKSSYDVPLYYSGTWENRDEQTHNYPPLSESYPSLYSEVQSASSKVLTLDKNSTRTPFGYFSEKPNVVSGITLKAALDETKHIPDSDEYLRKSKPKRRRNNKRNSRRTTEKNDTFDTTKKSQHIDSTPHSSEINNFHLNTLLLASANRNPGSVISSNNWNPMRVIPFDSEANRQNTPKLRKNTRYTQESDARKESSTTEAYRRRNNIATRNYYALGQETNLDPETFVHNTTADTFSHIKTKLIRQKPTYSSRYEEQTSTTSGPFELVRDPFYSRENKIKNQNNNNKNRFKNHRYN